MASMIDSMMEQLTKSGALEQVAGRLGVEPDKANAAVGSALPALMAGLAKNAQKPEGAAALSKALDDHDGSVLDDGSYFDTYQEKKGDRIVGHVFGEKAPAVESQISQLAGLPSGQGAQLLQMLAPLVMGYLGKEKKSGGGLDVSQLAAMLGGGGSGGGGLQLPGGLGDLLGGLGGGATAGSGATAKKGGLGGLLGGLFKKK